MSRSACLTLLVLILSAPAVHAATGDHLNLDLDARWASGNCWASAADGDVAYFGDGAIVRIVDFGGPSPVELGSVVLPGPVRGMDLAGNYLYVAGHEDGLRVVDVSNPAAPVEVGGVALVQPAEDVAALGTLACVAAGNHGLSLIDVTNPAAPVEVGVFDIGRDFDVVAASGTHAYLTGIYNDIHVVDVSNPAAPFQTGVWDGSTPGRDMAVVGDRLFAAQDFLVNVLDVSDPTNPTRIRGVSMGATRYAKGIAVDGNDVHVAIRDVAAGGVFAVYDWDEVMVSLTHVGETATYGVPMGVAAAGGLVFVEEADEGLTVFDASTPATPVEHGRWDTAGRTLGVKIHGDLILATDIGGGLHVLDRTANPPVRIGHVGLPGEPTQVHAQGNYAYVGARAAGLRVVDISDPANPVEVGFYDSGNWMEGVKAVGDVVYCADGYGGFDIVDVSDPTSPVLLSQTPIEAFFQLDVAGDLVYCALASFGLKIYDVSDPAAPVLVGTFDFADPLAHITDVAVSGNHLYVTNKEGPGLSVLDVSDPAAVFVAGGVSVPTNAYSVRVTAGRAYVTTGSGGVRVFDLTDPTSPVDDGFFDTGHDGIDVDVDGPMVVVADNWDGLWMLDDASAASVEIGPVPDGRPASILDAAPNPFNPTTRLTFALDLPAEVRITIHDARGRTVRSLPAERLGAGDHARTWDGRDDAGRVLPSGVYMARLEADGATAGRRRLVLVR